MRSPPPCLLLPHLTPHARAATTGGTTGALPCASGAPSARASIRTPRCTEPSRAPSPTDGARRALDDAALPFMRESAGALRCGASPPGPEPDAGMPTWRRRGCRMRRTARLDWGDQRSTCRAAVVPQACGHGHFYPHGA
jgi:hypothetical protein